MTTLSAKRRVESTPEWPKRHKTIGQTGSISRTGISSSSPQLLGPPYQVEGYPFPDFPRKPVEAAFPSTQTGSHHGNAWHQPTPPSTSLESREASSPSTVDGYQFNSPISPSEPFAYPTHDQASYRPSQNHEPNRTLPQNQFCYANEEPQLPVQYGSSIPTAGTNHAPAIKWHSHFASSQDGYGQAQDDLQDFKPLDTEENDYFVGESDEEEMAKLADPAPVNVLQIPPSSVIREMDPGSIIEVFDPSLQRSSPKNGPEHGDGNTGKDEPYFQDEDLLSSDIDWDSVFESVQPHSNPISSRDTLFKAGPIVGNSTLTAGIRSGPCSSTGTSGKIQSTHRGLPPPSPAVGKSISTGPPNTSKMRTFFRIGELVNEGKMCFYSKKQATFELYAWVTHSWRESPKVQHFHFMDIYEEQRQNVRGTLSGWRTGEVLDVQSSAFLSTHGKLNPKLCRCVCRLFQDHKVGMGWFLGVIWIREATWEELSAKDGYATLTW